MNTCIQEEKEYQVTDDSNEPMAVVDDNEPEMKIPLWKAAGSMTILYLLFLLDHGAKVIISPMFPLIKQDLGVTDAQLGLLSSILMVAIALAVFPISYLADRWRRSKLISLMAIIWSIGSILSGLSHSVVQLFASRTILGVGEASFAPTGIALISMWFKKSVRATLIGIWNTAMPLGMAAGMILGGILSAKYGWRTTLIIVGIPGIVLGIMAWFMPEKESIKKITNKQEKKSELTPMATVKSLLKNPSLVALCLAFGISNLAPQGYIYWLPSFFNRYMGMDIAAAGKITGALMLTLIIGFPVGGFLADKWSKKTIRAKMYLAFVATICHAILFSLGFYYKSIPLIGMAMFMFSIYPTAVHTMTQELVPSFNRSVSYGMLVIGIYIFGTCGPTIVGFLSKNYNLQLGMMWLNVCSLVAAFIFLIGSRTYARDYNKAREIEKTSGI